MTRRNKRLLIDVLKPVWEVGVLLEKIPHNLPADLKKWTVIALTCGGLATGAYCAIFWNTFGFLMWEQVSVCAQLELLVTALFSLLYATPGLLRSSHQAALEAGQWKQACLEGKRPPLELPEF